MDYSISLNGLFSSCRNLEQAARRIAMANPATDVVAELVDANRAEIAGEANLRVISVEMDLEGRILDLFA
jgi:hypothetical protein